MTNFITSFSPVVVIVAICAIILGIIIAAVALRVIWDNDLLRFRSLLTGKKRRRRRRAPSLGDYNIPPK